MNTTWHTFTDGFVSREESIHEVHRVLQAITTTGVLTPMERFLRIWLSWGESSWGSWVKSPLTPVDTLDSAAHQCARTTWDGGLPLEEQRRVDYALQRTVGCTGGK